MFVYFPFHIWDVILPIDFHIFQRGRSTTRKQCRICHVCPGPEKRGENQCRNPSWKYWKVVRSPSVSDFSILYYALCMCDCACGHVESCIYIYIHIYIIVIIIINNYYYCYYYYILFTYIIYHLYLYLYIYIYILCAYMFFYNTYIHIVHRYPFPIGWLIKRRVCVPR